MSKPKTCVTCRALHQTKIEATCHFLPPAGNGKWPLVHLGRDDAWCAQHVEVIAEVVKFEKGGKA